MVPPLEFEQGGPYVLAQGEVVLEAGAVAGIDQFPAIVFQVHGAGRVRRHLRGDEFLVREQDADPLPVETLPAQQLRFRADAPADSVE